MDFIGKTFSGLLDVSRGPFRLHETTRICTLPPGWPGFSTRFLDRFMDISSSTRCKSSLTHESFTGISVGNRLVKYIYGYENKLFCTNTDNNKRLKVHVHIKIWKRCQGSSCNIEKRGRLIDIFYTKYANSSL